MIFKSSGSRLSRIVLLAAGLGSLLATPVYANALSGSADRTEYRATLAIEAAMRTWQERYQAVMGPERKVTWPARQSDGALPGEFPEECFYQDDLKDDASAARLVEALAKSMTEIHYDPTRSYVAGGEVKPMPVPVLSHFIAAPFSGDLAGQRYFTAERGVFARKNILNFDIYEDLPIDSCFTGITAENHRAKFADIAVVLSLVDRPVFTHAHDPHGAIQFIRTDSTAVTAIAGDCATAKQDALALFRIGNTASGFLSTPSLRVINRVLPDGDAPRYQANIFWVAGRFEIDTGKLPGRATPYYSRNDVGVGPPTQPGNFPADYATTLTRLSSPVSGKWTSPIFTPPARDLISNGATPCASTLSGNSVDEGWEIYLHVPVDVDWQHHLDAILSDCGDCKSCESDTVCEVAKNSSVDFSISLGSGQEGSYGTLRLHADKPSVDLLSPRAWRRHLGKGVRSIVNYSSATSGSPTGANPGPLTPTLDPDYLSLSTRSLVQLYSPEWVMDVAIDSPTRHHLRFYHRTHVGERAADTGRFSVAAAQPFVAYTIESADETARRVVITATRGHTAPRVHTYDYDPATDGWSLLTGADESAPTESVSWRYEGATHIQTRTVAGADGAVVSRTETHYRVFPWNDPRSPISTDRRELVAEINDPEGAALTTRYAYYEDRGVDRESYGRRKAVEYQDGSWERYVYDRSGRLARIIRPHLDSPVTAPESHTRVSEERITTVSDIDGDGRPERLIARVERGLGLETARTYTLVRSAPVLIAGLRLSRADTIACQIPGAAWDDPSNLVSVTHRYLSGPDAGKHHSTIGPDGTLSVTRYARTGDALTIITETGAPAAASTSVAQGRRTTTVIDASGVTRTVEVRDIAAGLLLDLRETLPDEIDEQGRVLAVHHLDGTTESFAYGCCGLATSVDRAGVATFFFYDSLKRREAVERAGITERTVLDAAGRVLEQRRIGSDGSSIVTARNTYDLAGRLTASRDAGDRLTRYRDEYLPNGRRRHITTRADLAESIEEYHRDGRLAHITGTAVHPLRHTYDIVTDTHDGRTFTAETARTIRLGEADAETEWTETFTDMLGRSYKSLRPAFAGGLAPAPQLNFYNLQGQLARSVSPDGVTRLYSYDAEGQLAATAIDADNNGVIDLAGADRLTTTTRTFLAHPERGIVERSTVSVLLTTGDAAATVARVNDTNRATNTQWSTSYDHTTESRLDYLGEGVTRTTTRGPDGVVRTDLATHGRPTSSTVVNAVGEVFQSSSYAYDAHGRLVTATDARNGATTYDYYADGSLKSVTTPAPSEGEPRQTTTYIYDTLGRLAETVLPDGARAFTDYFPTGEVRRTHGGRQYPVAFTYDHQGRMKTLTTWKDHAAQAGAATTTWGYDPARGALLAKTYADGNAVRYTYTPAGRLRERRWARGVTTTYAYDPTFGDLAGITYSDTTPAVTYSYDRAGRPASVADAVGLREFDYLNGQLRAETQVTGDLAGHVLTRGYDTARLAGLQLTGPDGQLHAVGYHYRDTAGRDLGRLTAVTAGDLRVAYTNTSLSTLPAHTTWTHAGVLRQTTTHTWDKLDRLTEQRTVAGDITRGTAYAHNLANQRTRATLPDGEYWQFGYDELGQVTAGAKHHPNANPIPGYVFDYTFDDIGNRRSSTANGHPTNYVANDVNAYESREVPRVIDLLGEAPAAASVTINSVPALLTAKTDPALNYFYSAYPAENAGRHVFTIASELVGPPAARYDEQRVAYQPPPTETYAHDPDGNLTDDWRWRYTWDAENRLIQMDTQPAAIAAGVPNQRIVYRYDAQGRRIRQTVTQNPGTATYAMTTDLRYLYDGWNLLAELDATGSVVRRHTWGTDLSGSLQGAGGVGGLLATEIGGTVCLPAYDGNGNVLSLINAADGTFAADYEYDPFGNTLKAIGPLARANRWRFSTKYTDNATGLVYYGFRYYNPSIGRWLSRDPIEESGGLNLYGMVGNDPISFVDPLGLALYAFDGTKNDGYKQEAAGNETNVYILWKYYEGKNKRYLPGVGTNDGLMNPFGLAFGYGGQSRVKEMLDAAGAFIAQGDLDADIIGFSRGAAQARDFANKLKEKYPCVNIRWMGLFDTVASIGFPGNINLGYNLSIPSGTGAVLHLTAGAERRRTRFALTSINASPLLPNSNPNYREEEMASAVHSDVGGFYGNNRGLANQALIHMWWDGLNHGVPFGAIPSQYLNTTPNGANDSRWPDDKLVELITGPRERKNYYRP